MSMTRKECINLKVGDWILFDINTPFGRNISDSCQPLLDGKPHQIIDAEIEDRFYRLKFNEVKSNPYKLGWCYYKYILYMTKVNPPEYFENYIQLDIQKEVDLIIPKEELKKIIPKEQFLEYKKERKWDIREKNIF